MPRKGEYRRDPRQASQDVAPVRIGLRRLEGIEPSGRHGSTTINPAEFVCSALATELADEWMELAATDDLGVATMRCYRRAVRSFCQFIDTHLPAAAEASLAYAVPDLLPMILDWTRQLPTRWPAGSTEPAHQAGRLRKLIKRRAAHPDRAVAAHLNGWLTGSSGLRRGATREVDEFSRADKKALVQAARADIKQLEQRLRRGRELLERGVDPEMGGWLEPANLLWAIEHGMPTRELLGRLPSLIDWPAELTDLLPQEVALNYRGRTLLRVLTGMLYPHNRDLHGFRILLMAATGHTSEEVTGLAEDPGGVHPGRCPAHLHQEPSEVGSASLLHQQHSQ